MSKMSVIKELILNILADNQSHSIKEFYAQAQQKGYIQDSNDASIRNAIHHLMKTNTSIHRLEKGVYTMTSDSSNYMNEEELSQSIHYIFKTLNELNSFNWIECSDTELQHARAAVKQIKELVKKAEISLTNSKFRNH